MPYTDIEYMHPTLRIEYKEVAALMAARKLPWILTSVLRTLEEQVALATQGRSFNEMLVFFTNAKRADIVEKIRWYVKTVPDAKAIGFCQLMRKEAKLPPLAHADWGVVTWTLKSRHLPDAKGFSRAFDGAITKNGIPTWNLKVDVNLSKVPDYDEYGMVVEEVGGLIWGGRFKDKQGRPKPDRPHAELKPGLT